MGCHCLLPVRSSGSLKSELSPKERLQGTGELWEERAASAQLQIIFII